RIRLVALERLLEDVLGYPVALYEWDAHRVLLGVLSCQRDVLQVPVLRSLAFTEKGVRALFSAQPSVPVRRSRVSRKLCRICAHSILNQGVNRSGEDSSSASRSVIPTHRQSAISLTLASTGPAYRP